MKCYIVKDLLPNYVEKLTSEETNIQIEKHLDECMICNQEYEAMIKTPEPVQPKNATMKEKNLYEIKYLKKIKKNTVTKIIVGIVAASIICIAIFATGGMFLLKRIANNMPDYGIVAYNITKDNAYGPSVYEGEVYFPISEHEIFPDSQNSPSVGYFGFTKDGEPTIFFKLFLGNQVYLNVNDTTNDTTNEYLKIRGGDGANWRKASAEEADMNILEYKEFYIYDENWLEQTAFSIGGRAGVKEINKEIIESLENEFGVVEYFENDFDEYDAYYTIKGYKQGESEENGLLIFPDTIGCILVHDGFYYYGNLKNQITGDTQDQIKKLVEKK